MESHVFLLFFPFNVTDEKFDVATDCRHDSEIMTHDFEAFPERCFVISCGDTF